MNFLQNKFLDMIKYKITYSFWKKDMPFS